MSNTIVQSIQSPHRRILFGWVFGPVSDEQQFTPDSHLPPAHGRHRGVVSEGTGPRGDNSGGAPRRHPRCWVLPLELALDFPEEEGMMQQSSVSISLSF